MKKIFEKLLRLEKKDGNRVIERLALSGWFITLCFIFGAGHAGFIGTIIAALFNYGLDKYDTESNFQYTPGLTILIGVIAIFLAAIVMLVATSLGFYHIV